MGERSSRRGPRWTRSPYLFDGLIAAAIAVFALAGFFAAERTPDYPREADALGVVLILLAAGGLAFRRRWPLAVFVVVGGAAYAEYLLGYPETGVPFTIVIALYTLASQCDRWIATSATVALCVLIPVAFVIRDAEEKSLGPALGTLIVLAMAALWGDRTKMRDAYAEQLELRAAEKERQRAEAADRAVAAERLRIARELHDVVAHAMSVVAVQSGVGAHVIDSRPDEAKRILQTISETSRESLAEMRRLLGVLRDDPSPVAEDLTPAPGLGAIAQLAARVREAGVAVEIVVRGEERALPPGVDLAAYRIVQEGLTNVLKHAGPARATVVVTYERDAVHVEVVDDGRGAGAPSGNGAGHGLVGMRERAALYGGTLEAGPGPGGGYRVAATLRLASAAVP